MGRGAGAVEGFVVSDEPASKEYLALSGKRGSRAAAVHKERRRPRKNRLNHTAGKLGAACCAYNFDLCQDVGAEKVARGFSAADQAGALPFD